jgi:hypothetical protein
MVNLRRNTPKYAYYWIAGFELLKQLGTLRIHQDM